MNSVGNLADISIRAALDNLGADSSTVKFLEIPFPDMPPALESGTVDAINEIDPFDPAAGVGRSYDLRRRLRDGPAMPTGHWVAMDPFYQDNKHVIEGFTAAINKANAFANENPEAVHEAIASYTEIPPDVIAKIRIPEWFTQADMEGLETVTEITLQYGPDGLDEVEPADFVIPEQQ